eukprot:2852035-Pyramimonas_sp.AAC.3
MGRHILDCTRASWMCLVNELADRHLEAAAVQRLHAHVHGVVHQHLRKVVNLLHTQPESQAAG